MPVALVTGLKLECEFAFRLARDLDAARGPFTAAGIADSLVFHPAVELAGSRYAPGTKAGEKSELEAAAADESEEPVGYIRTAAYGGQFGAPTLGQAVSVSGAAASPNMGYHTSPVTAFLLTLFNVRLGWWFPNPSKVGSDVASPGFSLPYLMSELFGGATDQSRFLMISDGGHFENLAGYELIQRRCRVVILSDAECDPSLTFAGLGTLIRMAEVDFGVKITINVDPIRSREGSFWSKSRYAIGTIDYGAGTPPGTLIYIKAAIPEGEGDTALLQYKSDHPAFPHESRIPPLSPARRIRHCLPRLPWLRYPDIGQARSHSAAAAPAGRPRRIGCSPRPGR